MAQLHAARGDCALRSQPQPLDVGMEESLAVGEELRRLPSADRLLHALAADLAAQAGHAQALIAVRQVLEQARLAIQQGAACPAFSVLVQQTEEHMLTATRPSLLPVINATGVIIHTNLGRAPVCQSARAALTTLTAGYTNLEYDLAAGARGSRYDHATQLLARLTGAEAALVVNNNAAAVFLVLSALAVGREVVISRGQLVEIGGGFRIPDVLRASGARLVEVGTTNRTHLRDYAQAISPQTAALMRVHFSNFRQLGFTTEVGLGDLVSLAHSQGLLVVDDLGSGTLLDTTLFGLSPEPTVQNSVAAGADLITFSGDKLMGGPQAGLIVGRAELIARLRSHPLARALRVGKMTLAALNATLLHYLRGDALTALPVWQMIAAQPADLRARVESWRQTLAAIGIQASAVEVASTVGGGSLPGETLDSVALAVPLASGLIERLRQGSPPVVARVAGQQALFDARTVLVEQDEALLSAIAKALLS